MEIGRPLTDPRDDRGGIGPASNAGMRYRGPIVIGVAACTYAGAAAARSPEASPTLVATGAAVHRPLPLVPASAGDPLEELRRTDISLGAALRRRFPDWSPEADAARIRVDSILAGILDYERISRAALGANWSRLTEDQRRSFLTRFSALTNQAFVSALTRWDARVRFDSETIFGPTASVLMTASSEAAPGAPNERIEYRLGLKQGRWMVYDVLVDDVSLVDGYRSQFASLMRRGGFEEILSRMQRKLEEGNRP